MMALHPATNHTLFHCLATYQQDGVWIRSPFIDRSFVSRTDWFAIRRGARFPLFPTPLPMLHQQSTLQAVPQDLAILSCSRRLCNDPDQTTQYHTRTEKVSEHNKSAMHSSWSASMGMSCLFCFPQTINRMKYSRNDRFCPNHQVAHQPHHASPQICIGPSCI
ncbi:hypothetical protein SCLCIDRAFT_288143 [Scleroderma citrinum Foug A]|uniref:Uncharacterized protein n=1 Tax=Scleroderma citrinum Foug A TaxID=1036808 RepID=A0A0C3D4P8_9AGAM|nr:hypothetical protein SCLCIDRAFT_288143 [Scleroderma citrinum Foug A]